VPVEGAPNGDASVVTHNGAEHPEQNAVQPEPAVSTNGTAMVEGHHESNPVESSRDKE
jgi:hypothetical protein